MKKIGLSETKLFHFHGIFKKNEIKSAMRTPSSHLNPPSRNRGTASEIMRTSNKVLIVAFPGHAHVLFHKTGAMDCNSVLCSPTPLRKRWLLTFECLIYFLRVYSYVSSLWFQRLFYVL